MRISFGQRAKNTFKNVQLLTGVTLQPISLKKLSKNTNFRRATPKPAYVAKRRPTERSEGSSFFATQKTSACSDGFALIFVENTSKNAFLALAFLVLFCHQKSTENKFFRRKPLKKNFYPI
jgi:hypothetical protein